MHHALIRLLDSLPLPITRDTVCLYACMHTRIQYLPSAYTHVYRVGVHLRVTRSSPGYEGMLARAVTEVNNIKGGRAAYSQALMANARN